MLITFQRQKRYFGDKSLNGLKFEREFDMPGDKKCTITDVCLNLNGQHIDGLHYSDCPENELFRFYFYTGFLDAGSSNAMTLRHWKNDIPVYMFDFRY